MMYNSRLFRTFFAGFTLGATLSLIGQYSLREATMDPSGRVLYRNQPMHQRAQREIAKIHSSSISDRINEIRYIGKRNQSNRNMGFSDVLKYLNTKTKAGAGEDELAQRMFEKIRILCLVTTHPRHHRTQAKAVKLTWGKRCNVLLFVSTAKVTNATTVIVQGNETRKILWNKTKIGFQYAYDNHFDDADWFVKADDDTYLIMENLRLWLLDKDFAEPTYYGCKFKRLVHQGYMSGGSGYVLSKEALRLFIEKALQNTDECKPSKWGSEDAIMGRCLQYAGVSSVDTRDVEGKVRFLPISLTKLMSIAEINATKFWYWEYLSKPHKLGIDCCSNSVISLHYVGSLMMWALEYFLYHVHPFGIDPRLTGSEVKGAVIDYLNNGNSSNVTKSNKMTTKVANTTD